MTICPASHQKLELPLGNRDKSLRALPLVPLEVQQTLMMRQLQAAQRVPETRHPQTQVHLGKHGRLWPGHKLSKGSDCMEAQIKRIGDSHQDVWGHNHKIIRTEQKHALVDDNTSFKMRRMAARTDQLLHIAETTSSKIYTRESELEAQGPVEALVLSLKQFHTCYYKPHEKGTTRAMVGLQGLHSNNAF